MVVGNKGGGASRTGTVARADPDGYRRLLVAPDLAINESLVAKLSYDAREDFVPVIEIAVPLLVTPPSLPATMFQDFVGLARAQPGRISVGTGGKGTGTRLAFSVDRMDRLSLDGCRQMRRIDDEQRRRAV